MTWRHVSNFLGALMAAAGSITATVQGIASDAHALDWPAAVVAAAGVAILLVDKWVATAPRAAAPAPSSQAAAAPQMTRPEAPA